MGPFVAEGCGCCPLAKGGSVLAGEVGQVWKTW